MTLVGANKLKEMMSLSTNSHKLVFSLEVFIVTTLVIVVTYILYQKIRNRYYLNWIPAAPAPSIILGHAPELLDPTETLKSLRRHLEANNGLCTFEILGSKVIIASDPTFLEFLLGKTDILDKSTEYKYLNSWLGSGLLTAEGPKWKKTRKVLTPSFHFSVLESFIDVFEANGDILIELLEKEAAQDDVDIFPYCTMTTLDIICETAMGVSINAQRNSQSDYVTSVKEKCRLLIERSFSLKRFSILYYLSECYRRDVEYVKILHTHTSEVITSRKELKKHTKDELENGKNDVGMKKKKVFLDILLESTINGKPLTDTEIREEVDTFMFAGHDTTSTAISFCLYCLSTHQDVQKKVVEEQKIIFGTDKNRRATNRDLQEMKYLEMAIKESLRLYPSVPYTGRKASKDVQYKNGKIIPKHAEIISVIYVANRNPKYFPDPDKYDPDRFQENAQTLPYTYLPFSAGPRNCIGQKFAWNVMRSIISKVLRNYEVLPCGHEIVLSAEIVLKSKNGIRVKLRKRDWEKI